jgi:hypothetical protein
MEDIDLNALDLAASGFVASRRVNFHRSHARRGNASGGAPAPRFLGDARASWEAFPRSSVGTINISFMVRAKLVLVSVKYVLVLIKVGNKFRKNTDWLRATWAKKHYGWADFA